MVSTDQSSGNATQRDLACAAYNRTCTKGQHTSQTNWQMFLNRLPDQMAGIFTSMYCSTWRHGVKMIMPTSLALHHEQRAVVCCALLLCRELAGMVTNGYVHTTPIAMPEVFTRALLTETIRNPVYASDGR